MTTKTDVDAKATEVKKAAENEETGEAKKPWEQ